MVRRLIVAALAGCMAMAAGLRGQEATTPTLALADAPSTATIAAQQPGDSPEVAFLRLIEAKNGETRSLQAEFTQTRVDRVFSDEVVSEGEFWYEAPGLFRASYKGDKDSGSEDSDIWMKDNKLISYTPSLRQVEIVQQAAGDRAPVNQLLLGFGVKVERIQRLFEVQPAAKPRPGTTGIRFVSRDVDFSLGYDSITVYFDTTRREPQIILLEQEDQEITVELKKVRMNPQIKPSVFETKWPKNVEILEYKQL